VLDPCAAPVELALVVVVPVELAEVLVLELPDVVPGASPVGPAAPKVDAEGPLPLQARAVSSARLAIRRMAPRA